MYYFLGIVAQSDADKGNFIPSYILCSINRREQMFTEWIVYKCNSRFIQTARKILTRSITGKLNDVMIDFLSHYRTRDHSVKQRGNPDSIKRYYPKGFMCWFPCNIYGEQIGPALIICKVPNIRSDYMTNNSQHGKEVISRKDKDYTLKEKLCRQDAAIKLQTSGQKPFVYSVQDSDKTKQVKKKKITARDKAFVL